jgi:predicted DNA-binding transcriptional regulator YafY
LGQAARNALAKIGAVLPADLKDSLDSENLMVGPRETIAAGDSELPRIRTAIRGERMLDIAYADEKGRATQRRVWPFALAFFDRARVMLAWCELRRGYRSFRTDRIRALKATNKRYPRRRQALLKEWRADMVERDRRNGYTTDNF